MGGALWRYGTQEEGCTNHSLIHSFTAPLHVTKGCVHSCHVATYHSLGARSGGRRGSMAQQCHTRTPLLP
jgi:hypothetical protein